MKEVVFCELISSGSNEVNVQLSNDGPSLRRMFQASSHTAAAITLSYFLQLTLHNKAFFEDVLII